MNTQSTKTTESTRRGRSARLFQRPRGHPRPLGGVGRWLRILGPGLITGAADEILPASAPIRRRAPPMERGMLWLTLYMLPFMIAVQEMCGRIGLVTGEGIAGVVKTHYNRQILHVAVALLLIANTINIGADLGAMAASTRLLAPGVPFFTLAPHPSPLA